MKQLKAYLLLMIAIAIGCPNSFGASKKNSYKLEPQLYADSMDFMFKESYMVPYVKYLMNADLDEEANYAITLVYLDDDDMPEMIVRPAWKLYDTKILTQYENKVVAKIIGTGEISFIERQGLIKNVCCSMGGTQIFVYQLSDGKIEQVANMSALDDLSSSYEVEIIFSFNEVTMDEESAELKLKEAFEDKGDAINCSEMEWMSWDELLQQKESIKGWK